MPLNFLSSWMYYKVNAAYFSIYSLLHTFSGYGKTVSHVVIGLKTAKGTKQLKLDPSIYESLQKEKVEVGDVIYIEANSGAVKVSTNSHIYRSFVFVEQDAN